MYPWEAWSSCCLTVTVHNVATHHINITIIKGEVLTFKEGGDNNLKIAMPPKVMIL